MCEAVGYNAPYVRGRHDSRMSLDELTLDGGTNDYAREECEEDEDSWFMSDDSLPSFIHPELAAALPRARRSLKLLYAAAPYHPLCTGESSGPPLQWIWTEIDVRHAWSGTPQDDQDARPPSESVSPCSPIKTKPRHEPSPSRIYKPGLDAFQMFDCEPSAQTLGSLVHVHSSSNLEDITHFVNNYPDSLPSLTPTLPLLSNLVLFPLVEHVSKLSTAVLATFLPPTMHDNFNSLFAGPVTPLPMLPSGHLDLRGHLILLRSYLLLTSPAFKSRLCAALFSDSDTEGNNLDAGNLSTRFRMKRLHSELPGTMAENGVPSIWAVGLAPGLTARETWPPGGADLSFVLRTVIVDALQSGSQQDFDLDLASANSGDGTGFKVVTGPVAEAEYRLGFAIRELPSGPGRDKWLNPLCKFVMKHCDIIR
jgi:hypothetical protein